MWKREKRDVAVKTGRRSALTKKELENFMTEARMMRQYKHANIVHLYGVTAKAEPLMIIMELVPGGTLRDYLRKKGCSVATGERVRFCLEAARGMEYLDSKRCIHRDLAARNCLLTESNEVKISDFGLAIGQSSAYRISAQSRKVAIRWLAPETIKHGN